MKQEMQNCLEEANWKRASLNGQNQGPIQHALRRGHFVVVRSSPYFCKSTDAFAGVVTGFEAQCDTREEADKLVQDRVNEQGFDGEDTFAVLPEVEIAKEVCAGESDGLPF